MFGQVTRNKLNFFVNVLSKRLFHARAKTRVTISLIDFTHSFGSIHKLFISSARYEICVFLTSD